MIAIAGNKHISNLWLEESSFDQTPNYCLFCMPRPSQSCPKASCSLSRYVSMAVAPRHTTKEETAKLAWVTQEMSVPRNTPEGSFSSQIHLTSITHTARRAGSKQQEDQDHRWLSSYTSPQDCSASEQVSCIRTQESPQCNVPAVLHGPGPLTVKGSAQC